jgi:hypothetical protein
VGRLKETVEYEPVGDKAAEELSLSELIQRVRQQAEMRPQA